MSLQGAADALLRRVRPEPDPEPQPDPLPVLTATPSLEEHPDFGEHGELFGGACCRCDATLSRSWETGPGGYWCAECAPALHDRSAAPTPPGKVAPGPPTTRPA